MKDPIAAAYARRIKRGAITIEDVPSPKREAVRAILVEDGMETPSPEIVGEEQ